MYKKRKIELRKGRKKRKGKERKEKVGVKGED